jgi:heme A synthase
VPRSPTLDTWIELSHRLSSGVLGILVVGFVIAAFRASPRGSCLRRGAGWSLFFVVTEALIGAGLVKFEWVASNTSEERAYVIAFHLVNTFLLLGVLTLTAHFASGGAPLRPRARPRAAALLGLVFGVLLAVGASGAVTALGDTLVLTEGIAPENSPFVAALVARRFYHPTLAVASFLLALGVFRIVPVRKGRGFLPLFAAQLAAGAVNVLLKAPVAMQLLHLGISDVLWILLVLVAADELSSERAGSGAQAEVLADAPVNPNGLPVS